MARRKHRRTSNSVGTGTMWGHNTRFVPPSAKVQYFRGQRVVLTDEGRMLLESIHPKTKYPPTVYAVIVSFPKKSPQHANLLIEDGNKEPEKMHMKTWRPA